MSKISWHPITSDPFEALTAEAQARILAVLEPHESRPSSRAPSPAGSPSPPVPAPRVGDYIADILGIGLPHPADGGLNPYCPEVRRVFALDNEVSRLEKEVTDECFCAYLDPGFPGPNMCNPCLKRATLAATRQKRDAAFQLALPDGHPSRVFSNAEIADRAVQADSEGYNRVLLRGIRLLLPPPDFPTPPAPARRSPDPTPRRK